MQNKTIQDQAEKLNIEESREKRLGRIKAKRRDRGGIFQPREDNPLLEILMSRDVSGRSPTKPRSRSQRASADRDIGGSTSQTKKSAASQGMARRKPVAPNASPTVAAKQQRRKSEAPPSNAEYSDKEKVAKGRTKPSTTSRNPSRQTETSKGKSPARPSKRLREVDENNDVDDIELPSPPKRLKKSNVSKTTTSTSTIKMTKSSRKPPSESKLRPKTKGKAPSMINDDAEDEEMSTEITLPPAEKKRGKQKTATPSKSKKNSSGAAEDRPTSTPKSKRPPGTEKAASSTKTGVTAKAKKSSKPVTSEEQIAAALNTGFNDVRRKGKKKADPVSEPESEEETYYRTKIPKPRLDTVFEEEEENEAPAHDDGDGEIALPEQTISSRLASAPKRKATKDSGTQKVKRKARDDFAADVDAPLEATASVSKKSKAKGKTEARSKSSTRTTGDSEARDPKPLSAVRRKPKASASSSKQTSKPTSKPKSSRQSKPKAKQQSQTMQKSRFANLPTTVFSSPLKVVGNDDDEIDFLS